MADALRVEMWLGDCLEVMPRLASGGVDMVFADLPYGFIRRHWDIPLKLDGFWPCVIGASKANGRFIFTAALPFAVDLIAKKRKMFRYGLVWNKRRTTGFLTAKKRPLRQHEQILVFANGKGTYNPQKTLGKAYSIKRRAGDLNYMDNVNNNHVSQSSGERYPTSIVALPSQIEKSIHPTQKPVALLEWLIKTYTNFGDTVLDPCAGSFTTAVAALKTGRNSICIEKDKAYFAAGVERVKAEIAASGVNADLMVHG